VNGTGDASHSSTASTEGNEHPYSLSLDPKLVSRYQRPSGRCTATGFLVQSSMFCLMRVILKTRYARPSPSLPTEPFDIVCVIVKPTAQKPTR
jgi:hypothetical protein